MMGGSVGHGERRRDGAGGGLLRARVSSLGACRESRTEEGGDAWEVLRLGKAVGERLLVPICSREAHQGDRQGAACLLPSIADWHEEDMKNPSCFW